MSRLALLGCAVALLAAGCGGGAAGGLTKDEFVAELDRICADFRETQDALPEPQSLEEIAERGTTMRKEFGAAIERIRDLGEPPEEIRTDVNRFLEISDELHRRIGELVEAAEEEDVPRLQGLADEGEELQQESDEIAERLDAEC